MPSYTRVLIRVAACYTVVALGYIIAAQLDGFYLPNSTGMPPAWAAIFGLAGTSFALIRSSFKNEWLWLTPTYRKALFAMQVFLVFMLLIGFVSLIVLGDANGAAWTAAAFTTTSIWLIMDVRATHHTPAGAKAIDPEIGNASQVVGPPASDGLEAKNGCCRRCCISCGLWTPLVFAGLIIGGFGIGTTMKASNLSLYPPPGSFYTLQTRANETGTTTMQMYCVGPKNPSLPTYVFEAGGGSSGFAFYGAQQYLAQAGYRSCAYDRSGYGWSETTPLSFASTFETQRKLHDLLQQSDEQPPYILVGHSVGVELVQVYAYYHPNDVVGLALLDGYPNYLYLLGYTKSQISADDSRVCAALQAARAFDAVGLTSLISWSGQFTPQSESSRYVSTYTNGKNWNAQYNEYCRYSGPQTTDFLTSAAGSSNYGQNPDHPNVKWPKLQPNVKVLIISAKTVLSTSGKTETDNIYYVQARAYNQTLSPTNDSKWTICATCNHGFPWEEGQYLADELLEYF